MGKMIHELVAQESNIHSIEYINRINPAWKKKNGVFYTDINLCIKIIESLAISKDSHIFDPCCGIGNFLKAAEYLGFRNTFGCDIDSNAISICEDAIQKGNFFVCDSLYTQPEELLKQININKFDVIIGNPPFAKLNIKNLPEYGNKKLGTLAKIGNNLFILALLHSLELVKFGGTVSYIIPKNFLHVSVYQPIREYLLQEFVINSIVDIGSYFKDVRGEQVVITIINSKPQNNMIKYYKFKSGEFIEQSRINQKFYTNEIFLFENNEDYWLYQKLNNSNVSFKNYCSGYIGRGRSKSINAVSGKDLLKFGYKNSVTPTKGRRIFIQNIYSSESGIIGAFGGELEAAETITIITDNNRETALSLLGLLHSRLVNLYLYKFCFNNSKLTMHTDSEYIRKIPIPKEWDYKSQKLVNLVEKIEKEKYLSTKWLLLIEELNHIVNRMYNLSNKEIAYLETEARKIQSKKWFFNE